MNVIETAILRLLWNDTTVGVEWPLHLLAGEPLLPAKDVAGTLLAECETF